MSDVVKNREKCLSRVVKGADFLGKAPVPPLLSLSVAFCNTLEIRKHVFYILAS